jgi:hypothetical protein
MTPHPGLAAIFQWYRFTKIAFLLNPFVNRKRTPQRGGMWGKRNGVFPEPDGFAPASGLMLRPG